MALGAERCDRRQDRVLYCDADASGFRESFMARHAAALRLATNGGRMVLNVDEILTELIVASNNSENEDGSTAASSSSSSSSSLAKKSSSLRDELATYTWACEQSTSGWLLDSNITDSWPVRCVWTADSPSGNCIPVPPHLGAVPFTYVNSNVWAGKLREVRRRIGCKPEDVRAVDDVGELFVCREDCTQAGLSDTDILMMELAIFLTLVIAF